MKHHSLSRTGVALALGPRLRAGCNDNDSTPKPAQPTLGHRTVSLIEQDGLQFKDLDGSGTLTPYEDWRLGAAERARDLVGRLTLAQKAGLMMHGTLVLDGAGRVNLVAMDKMLREDGVNTFITRIVGNLRARDRRLAALRQRAAVEEHIVRMGLLASGAAHELGTPLSTLAVILGDWQHDKRLADNTPLQEDIREMQAQVQRCKSIVSGILLSAGEARGEESVQTTVCTFVDALAREWRSTRSMPTFEYDNQFGADTPMVSDTTLQQMVFNVLDNARDASPDWVRLAVTRNADVLNITVTDRGPGFAPDMLSKLGTPYQSTKNRPGHGLGLYLVLNVARTLGGSVAARNLPEGGAQVTIELPLAAIALPSYTQYVQRSHRAHARAALLQTAKWLERAATAQGSYPAAAAIPAGVMAVEGGRYNVAVNAINAATFVLQATPNAAQLAQAQGWRASALWGPNQLRRGC